MTSKRIQNIVQEHVISDINVEALRKAGQYFGKMGGDKTLAQLGVEHYKRISRKGVEARAAKRAA